MTPEQIARFAYEWRFRSSDICREGRDEPEMMVALQHMTHGGIVTGFGRTYANALNDAYCRIAAAGGAR